MNTLVTVKNIGYVTTISGPWNLQVKNAYVRQQRPRPGSIALAPAALTPLITRCTKIFIALITHYAFKRLLDQIPTTTVEILPKHPLDFLQIHC
jgi:hypothetical protein